MADKTDFSTYSERAAELLYKITGKSKEEIVSNGTLDETTYLKLLSKQYCKDPQDKLYLSKEDKQKMEGRGDIANIRCYWTVAMYADTSIDPLYALLQYYSSMLARYVTEWDMYQDMIPLLTQCRKLCKEEELDKFPDGVILDSAGGSIHFNKDTNSYVLNMREELMECIKRWGYFASVAMQVLKQWESAMKEFTRLIGGERVINSHFKPLMMTEAFHSVTTGEVYKYTDLSKKYFESTLLARKRKGESVTKEEEAMAVFPDYNNVTVDTKVIVATAKVLKSKYDDLMRAEFWGCYDE